MIGGYQILDLRSIDLQKSGSASSITDPYVLKQLLMFRDHIDKAYNFSKPLVNQLKPVLIRFRDKKSGEKTEGSTFGELSVDGNYYTFKVTARISGALVLTIVVAFEEITNDYGNKEWVIDTATIQLKDESKTINGNLELTGNETIGGTLGVTGASTLSGNVSVGGKLTVTGAVEGSSVDMSGKIEGAEIVEKMSGYSAQLVNSTAFTSENVYHGVVKNGNKITVVGAIKLTKLENWSSGDLTISEMFIPSAIGSKLYPVTIGAYNKALAVMNIVAANSYNNLVTLQAMIEKNSNGKLVFWLTDATKINQLEANTEYYIRIEATFLLSDNLIPSA